MRYPLRNAEFFRSRSNRLIAAAFLVGIPLLIGLFSSGGSLGLVAGIFLVLRLKLIRFSTDWGADTETELEFREDAMMIFWDSSTTPVAWADVHRIIRNDKKDHNGDHYVIYYFDRTADQNKSLVIDDRLGLGEVLARCGEHKLSSSSVKYEYPQETEWVSDDDLIL